MLIDALASVITDYFLSLNELPFPTNIVSERYVSLSVLSKDSEFPIAETDFLYTLRSYFLISAAISESCMVLLMSNTSFSYGPLATYSLYRFYLNLFLRFLPSPSSMVSIFFSSACLIYVIIAFYFCYFNFSSTASVRETAKDSNIIGPLILYALGVRYLFFL